MSSITNATSTEEAEWAMKAGSNNILVVLRCRPLNEKERRTCEEIVSIVDGKIVNVKDPGHFADNPMRRARMRDRVYAFDHAFDMTASQTQVYNATTRFLIEGVLAGYNATVFAYGPTGSGKTHTMLGQRDNPGIMVLTLRDLYAQIGAAKAAGRSVSVTMSLIEVYNENIRDLLAADAEDTDYLDLREDPVKGPCVAGVSEHDVESADDIVDLLTEGNRRRTQEPTAANKESSRSHAVLQVLVQQKEQYGTEMRVGKLSLIDLAGSERASNTQNRGIRLIEGANINRSLLALGNCITALVQGKGTFVPYRDSKLTRLLKDSLGGNTRTVMIGCISPSSAAFEETINTLKYCDRAKHIKIQVSRNVLNVNYHITEYENLIAGLRAEVAALKGRLSTLGMSAPSAPGTRPATASGIPMTASAVASHRGEFASALPLSSSLSSRQIAAISGTRPNTGPQRSALMAAGSAMISSHSTSVDGSHLDAAAVDRMRELRQNLVSNFQERMQIRRSLAEISAQNLENSTEIARRQVMLARMEQGSRLSAVSSSMPTNTAALREEISQLQRSSVGNSRLKDELSARLAENESAGEEIRLELDHYGTTEDRKELLALEYRVCLLELEKVELEQSQMLNQRSMQEKDSELKKLKQQLKARNHLISNQMDILQKHNLSHLVDDAAVAAIDSELTLDDLEASIESELAALNSLPQLRKAKPKGSSIWDGYSGVISETPTQRVPKPSPIASLQHGARADIGQRRSIGSTAEMASRSPSPIQHNKSTTKRSDSELRRASDSNVNVSEAIADHNKRKSPIPRAAVAPKVSVSHLKPGSKASIAAAHAVYGGKTAAYATRSERKLPVPAEEPKEEGSLSARDGKRDDSVHKRVPQESSSAVPGRAVGGVRTNRAPTRSESVPPPKGALSRLNGVLARGLKPSVSDAGDEKEEIKTLTPREPETPRVSPAESRVNRGGGGAAMVPVGSLESLKARTHRKQLTDEALSSKLQENQLTPTPEQLPSPRTRALMRRKPSERAGFHSDTKSVVNDEEDATGRVRNTTNAVVSPRNRRYKAAGLSRKSDDEPDLVAVEGRG